MRRSLTCTALLLITLAASALVAAQAEVPASAEPEAFERSLEEARERLEEAAREVARLTTQSPGLLALAERFGERSRQPVLGINIDMPTPEAASDGVRVAGVTPGGPAAAAGVRAGDVIVAIDGQRLVADAQASAEQRLMQHMREVQAGQAVTLSLQRDDARREVVVTAQPLAASMMAVLRDGDPADWPMMGELREGLRAVWPPGLLPGTALWARMELTAITPGLGDYFGTDTGLLVVRAPSHPDTPLADGDVILNIGGRVPGSPSHALRILSSYQPGETVPLEIMRRQQRQRVEIVVPPAEQARLLLPPGVFDGVPTASRLR